jgi:hypothetical protein
MMEAHDIKPIYKFGREYYTVQDFSRLIGKHPNTIRYWIRTKQLMTMKFSAAQNARVYIPIEEVNRVISGNAG